MMQPFLLRNEVKERVDQQQRSSKRNRNPRKHGWLTYAPPHAHAGIVDVFKRLNCSIADRKLHAKYHNAAFIDLTSFVNVHKAIDHGKHCLGWLQSEMNPLPLIWGQCSSNMQVAHELQLDNKLGLSSEYFKDGTLGPHLLCHPLYRTHINCATGYSSNLIKEIVIQAVIVWPSCFVRQSVEKWRQVLGQLEMFSQANWLETRGEPLAGNRETNMTSNRLMFTPTDADMLLSFIYSAEYHSRSVMAFSKNSKIAWPTALEGMQLRRDGSTRVLPPPKSRRLASMIDAYKLKMIPKYISEGGEVDDSQVHEDSQVEEEVDDSSGSMEPPTTSRAPRYYEEKSASYHAEISGGEFLSSEDDYLKQTFSSAGPSMTTRKGKRKRWHHLNNTDSDGKRRVVSDDEYY